MVARNGRAPAPIVILYVLAALLLLAGCGAGAKGESNRATLNSATQTPVVRASPVPSDPVIVAAGDIACESDNLSYRDGNGTANHCQMKATSDLALQIKPTAVLVLGDDQYEAGALNQFEQSYNATWGRLKSITHPIPGNHEYLTPDAAGYYAYFGAAAGDPSKGYYSYDIGAWHLIALNGECGDIGGCYAGSPEELWLKNDLATHTNVCTLAYWHEPEFDSGPNGRNTVFQAFWNDLYVAGAEIVLNGHSHLYERFAPQTPRGVLDTAHGVTQFTVGTGGQDHETFHTILPNSVARNATTFGVLELTLHPTSYTWRFVPIAGQSYTDSGSADCHGAP